MLRFPSSVLLLLFSLAVMVASFFALVVLADEGAAGKDASGAADVTFSAGKRIRTKRSIFQACRKDIERLCVDTKKGDERRASLRQAAQCLEEKESEVQDETCKTWLKARSVCFADAEKEGVCAGVSESATGGGGKDKKDKKEKFVGGNEVAAKRGRIMMCLRNVASEKLSDECTKSDFYKAILGLRRYHRQIRKEQGDKKQAKLKDIADKMAQAH